MWIILVLKVSKITTGCILAMYLIQIPWDGPWRQQQWGGQGWQWWAWMSMNEQTNGLAQKCNLIGSSTRRDQMRGPAQVTGPVWVGGGRWGEQRWMGGVDKRLNKCKWAGMNTHKQAGGWVQVDMDASWTQAGGGRGANKGGWRGEHRWGWAKYGGFNKCG